MSFIPPARLLLGPGPANVSPEVLAAQAQPAIGHLDPAFSEMMEEVKSRLRALLRTENEVCFPLSAPASLAMEAALANLLEPGDHAVIAQNGVFGGRMAEIARRCGAKTTVIEAAWGAEIDENAVREALKSVEKPKVLAFVHAETSTGVRSDAAALCAAARESGALSIVDCVTSLAGSPVETDAWGADAVYSGSQKCLGCPPGLAPITFSKRAVAAIEARTTPVQSWFCDLNLVLGYWRGTGAGPRSYHHTAPVNALYGLHEALGRLLSEGLPAVQARHAAAHARLAAGMERLGLSFLVEDPAARLPMLNAVRIPQGVDDAALRRDLLERRGIEIGAGLGPLAGKVWRIGLMGENARPEAVDALLDALAEALADHAAPRVAAQ
ncbi:MAG: alanine--glyoxylate aminotransferase family protein [Pseudomonadota bacterium]